MVSQLFASKSERNIIVKHKAWDIGEQTLKRWECAQYDEKQPIVYSQTILVKHKDENKQKISNAWIEYDEELDSHKEKANGLKYKEDTWIQIGGKISSLR